MKEIIADQRVPLSFDEQERIQADLLDEVFGLVRWSRCCAIPRSPTSWSTTRTTSSLKRAACCRG